MPRNSSSPTSGSSSTRLSDATLPVAGTDSSVPPLMATRIVLAPSPAKIRHRPSKTRKFVFEMEGRADAVPDLPVRLEIFAEAQPGARPRNPSGTERCSGQAPPPCMFFWTLAGEDVSAPIAILFCKIRGHEFEFFMQSVSRARNVLSVGDRLSRIPPLSLAACRCLAGKSLAAVFFSAAARSHGRPPPPRPWPRSDLARKF